ncbi:nucleotidyltransferase substrate binding protein [Vibrio maerlii]|uniref:nucleotidyltransferase substrate binding protein n=1 Tax=Vibrio maerlii TaxID=2231648 RepID=UPI000E3D049D|nr:nucleotidyltransferase substrate binding protein [Vibrio maerlii]
MTIDTTFLLRCIKTLKEAHSLLNTVEPESIQYEMYRSACVKEFEIILEQSGKLLKKALAPYMHSPRAVNRLVFKDIFRHAAQFDLITLEQAERWLEYRDNRNHVAHDYGVDFAKQTLVLLPSFIADAASLELVLREKKYD